ncbi:hypothetical protein DL93DRAFT_2059484 [Clavulina sp. PMI_390]|nr:hypothetical protein DL93DRAFT_2059484 [Clavulina sp. PMI_390]
MSDDEDDYLSDKFLLGDTSSSSKNRNASKPTTYSEMRKQALRAAEAKNAAGRKKSRREIVEEGLNTSLFDKAKEQEAAGMGKNKALGMMMKMGFKPGQSLGKSESAAGSSSATSLPPLTSLEPNTSGLGMKRKAGAEEHEESEPSTSSGAHRTEPIRVDFWAGRTGIGQRRSQVSGSRANPYAPSPKKARTEAQENETAEQFRERTRLEYEDRRAEARLTAATRTCVSLDEKKGGMRFNVLWLNPKNPNSCPPELLEAFTREAALDDMTSRMEGASYAAKLRDQMRRDALQQANDDGEDSFVGRPFSSNRKGTDDGEPDYDADISSLEFTSEQVAEAREFLNLSAKERLERVLEYLRDKYAYCFWCGTQYDSQEDMVGSCPGKEEDAHD